MKRDVKGRFSTRKHYRLPEEKIKPMLMWYYAGLGVLTSCYLIGGAFFECYVEIKNKYKEYAESKRIIIINEVGARADDRIDDVSGETKSSVSETDGDNGKVPESPEETIRRVADEMGFEEAENLVRLAKCESSLNPDAVNPTNNSYDRGVFQISRRWHSEISDKCAFDVACATEKSIEIIRNDGGYPHQWSCQGAW